MRQLLAIALMCAAVVACKPQAVPTSASSNSAAATTSASPPKATAPVPDKSAEASQAAARPETAASTDGDKTVSAAGKDAESTASLAKRLGVTKEANPVALAKERWPIEVRSDPRVLECASTWKGVTIECRTQDYEISINEDNCSASDGIYGATNRTSPPKKGKVQLYRDPEPGSPKGPALDEGVFLCTTAVANIHGFNESVWHYVRAIPASAVPKCKGNTLCKSSSVLPTACKADAKGVFSSACPSGWIEDENFVEYSMGI